MATRGHQKGKNGVRWHNKTRSYRISKKSVLGMDKSSITFCSRCLGKLTMHFKDFLKDWVDIQNLSVVEGFGLLATRQATFDSKAIEYAYQELVGCVISNRENFQMDL
jgi:hypothetical protein